MATAATSIGYLCFVEFVLFIRGRGRRLLLLAWAAGGQARPSSSWPPPSLLCLTVLRAPLPCSRSFPLVCIPASGDPLWSAPLLSVRLGSDRSSGCAFWLHSRCSVPRSWCSLRARDCTSGSSRRTKGVGGESWWRQDNEKNSSRSTTTTTTSHSHRLQTASFGAGNAVFSPSPSRLTPLSLRSVSLLTLYWTGGQTNIQTDTQAKMPLTSFCPLPRLVRERAMEHDTTTIATKKHTEITLRLSLYNTTDCGSPAAASHRQTS